MQTSPETFPPAIPRRRLRGALLLSLVLHLGLAAALLLPALQRDAPTDDATLTRVALHAAAGVPAAQPAQDRRASAPAPANTAGATAIDTPLPTAAVTADAHPAAAALTAVVAAPAVDDEDLRRRYLAMLGPWLAQHLWYPPTARAAGLEGRVGLHLVVRHDGSIASLQVRQGSGSSVLDAGALETVRRATPLPALPDTPGDTTLEIDLPVDFHLTAPGSPRP